MVSSHFDNSFAFCRNWHAAVWPQYFSNGPNEESRVEHRGKRGGVQLQTALENERIFWVLFGDLEGFCNKLLQEQAWKIMH